ncbi:MAG: carbamoyl phosphate synthase small subunit, partial [Clostridia bacterium]|nr:carbamoyl phosphate synthase small subunit [Clostridia bacterium]
FGARHDAVCEMVFNTGLTGYLELLTDASYAGQGIVMASPIMGNYGIFPEHGESWKPWVEAMVIRDLTLLDNDMRQAGNLDAYLADNGIPGLTGVDTRALTLRLRSSGTMNGLITDADRLDKGEAMERLRTHVNKDPVARVSRRDRAFLPARADAPDGRRYRVAMLDFGLKQNIVRKLNDFGCDVTLYPWETPAPEILGTDPDGVMLSNGPGDPKDCAPILPGIRALMDSGVPMFAICLGHQLAALAAGADTYKLKYGHRGINHPVKDLRTGRVAITSQNHGYAVDAGSVDPSVAAVTHVNLNDGSVEGLEYRDRPVFTVQYHPEGSPGPRDSEPLFLRFNGLMSVRR